MITVAAILFLAAIVCFILATAGWPTGINFQALGLMFLAMALALGAGVIRA